MNEMKTTVAGPSQPAAAHEFNIIDLLIILAKHKRLIIWLPVIVGIAATAISLALPNVYKASTKLLPPQQAQSSAAALLSQLGGAAGAVSAAAGLKNPNDVFIGILKSRSIADRLIQTFHLQKVYDTESLDKTRKILEDNTSITAGKDGLITIDVEDEDKKLVAQLANSYVGELVNMTKVLAVTEASQRRIFFEHQLELSKVNLATAEMTLKKALDTRGVISVDSDSRAIVETIGRLRAQISSKEIQLNSMQAFVTTNNQNYRLAKEELNSLLAELSKLENGRPELARDADQRGNKRDGLENIKILRDVKYHQMLYELLSKQYEAARLDEAKDVALIQVLDTAIEPERQSKPKRAIIILLSIILSFFGAICLAFISEIKEKILEAPEGMAQWEELKTLSRFK